MIELIWGEKSTCSHDAVQLLVLPSVRHHLEKFNYNFVQFQFSILLFPAYFLPYFFLFALSIASVTLQA